jgi:hypothetical protein
LAAGGSRVGKPSRSARAKPGPEHTRGLKTAVLFDTATSALPVDWCGHGFSKNIRLRYSSY